MPFESRLYSEVTGSIDTSVESLIVFSHGLLVDLLPVAPDDVGIFCADAGAPVVFQLVSKISTNEPNVTAMSPQGSSATHRG